MYCLVGRNDSSERRSHCSALGIEVVKMLVRPFEASKAWSHCDGEWQPEVQILKIATNCVNIGTVVAVEVAAEAETAASFERIAGSLTYLSASCTRQGWMTCL